MKGVRTRLRHGEEVGTDTTELGSGHGDRGSVLGLGDAKVLLVDVHKLEVVLGDAVVVGGLEGEAELIRGIVGPEGEDVLVLGGAEDLGQRGEVHAESDVTVAAIRAEAVGLEHHGHQGNVGVVHGLQGNAAVIAVEVAVLDEIFDGVDNLGGRGWRALVG